MSSEVGKKLSASSFNFVNGAMVTLNLEVDEGGAGTTTFDVEDLVPTGLKFQLLGVTVTADSTSGSPTVEVGTAADPDAYITSIAVTSGHREYQECDGASADSETSSVLVDSASDDCRVTVDHGVTLSDCSITLWMIPYGAPTDAFTS